MHGFETTRLAAQDPNIERGAVLDCDLFPEVVKSGAAAGFASLDCDRPEREDPNSVFRSGVPDSNEISEPIVRFSASDWRNLVRMEENLTLVGRFQKSKPSMDLIKAKVRSNFQLDGEIQVGSLDRRTVLLRFNLEEDCLRVWMKGQMVIEDCRLWFARWTPDWNSNRDSPLTLVWFELPKLPLHLFNFQSIARICAPIGRAIALDAATARRSRPSVAKVKLEIDVLIPEIDKIWIEFEDNGGERKGFWQSVVRGRVPTYCSDCGRFGHVQAACWKGAGRGVRLGEVVDGTDAVGAIERPEGAEGCPVIDPKDGGDTPSVCRNALEKEVGQGPNEKQAQEENNVTPCSLEKAIGVQQVDNTPLAKPVKKVLITGSRETEDTPKGKGSRAAGKFIEEFSMALEAIIQGSMGKKERKGKESGLGSEKSGAAHASVKGVSERNSKGEVREFKNSMDWVRVVEEFMKKDKLLDQKVKEAMKEINEYLWTVYDKEKEEYTEEGRNRAMKAATIFLVKVKHCPSWVSENGLLGKHLKDNIDTIGARICHWAVTLDL